MGTAPKWKRGFKRAPLLLEGALYFEKSAWVSEGRHRHAGELQKFIHYFS